MSENPANTTDWLSICDRVRSDASSRGYEALSSVEQAVHLSDNFNFEQENGGLSQFFYNSDCSPGFAQATAVALRTIGAHRTAEVLSQAASLFTQPPDGTLGSTWREYLAAVDPQNRLRGFEGQLPIATEDVFSLLESFVIQHSHELIPRNA